ncbi:beta-carotene 15,15'-monooxygenase [Haemophilus parainfluenzae]|jgi:raw score 6.03|uniref:Beta-carotene 15,15'-monooxygenase n=1 Tax=Haemophilus parainfluenzae TaxID=729 RepID=A0AB36E8J5_HAEPA|nr:GDYXXLXY domain-containing protein [Haemophilus parainfluenzae]OBY51624.1 beta-carotene 15,15'-monooxygenase [Haemophilus parainfluenzae]
MNTTGLFNLSWQRYLNLLFLLLTVGFLTSGVVTLIAANLDYFSDLAKIYGLQTLLVVTVILGLYCFIRESRRQAKEKLKWKTYSIFFVVSVLIGGLFALVGQTYQTGADLWQLFAVWTLCQLPFLLLFPNVASALLFATTTNVTFYLFNEQNSYNSMGYAVLINTGFLVVSELFSKTFHDQHWRILPKVFLVLTFASLFGLTVIYDVYFHAYAWGELGRSSLSSLQIAIPSLVAFYIYQKYRFDFINLIISVVAFLGAYCFWGSEFIQAFEDGLVLGLIGFIFTVMAINWLVKLYKREHPNNKKSHWATSILWVIALLIAVVTIGAWLFFSLGLDESSTLIIGIILFGIAWSLTLNKDKNEYTTILAGLFFLIANSFLGFYLLVKFDNLFLLLGYEFSEDSNLGIFISTLIFSVIIIVSYKLMPNSLVRILLVIQLLVYWQISYDIYFHSYSLNNTWFNKIQLLSSIGFFYWIMRPHQSERIHLKPIAWGMVLFSLWSSLPSYMMLPLVDYGLIDTDVSSDVMLSDAMSLNNILQVLSGRFWSHFQFDVNHILYLLICVLPLIVYALMNKHSKAKHIEVVLILLALSLFALGFIGLPVILYLTALLLLIYWTDSRAFFGLLVLAFIVYLGGFYYQLSIPLLYKGVLLVSFAVIFAIVTLFLHARYKSPSQSAVENYPVFKAPIGLVGVFLIALLGAVNYKVQQFEDVLATGKPVVLKIAPADPRSLMQGDYMVLNYAILSELQQSQFSSESNESNETTGIDELSPSGKKAYILVHLDKNHVATLCEAQSEIPTDFKHCTPNVYLPIRYRGWSPELPSQDYFFAEGKGEYYAQSEYAEYRFKDGILLLARLLDKDLKGL